MSKIVATVNANEITETELNEIAAAYQQQTMKPEVSEEEKKMLLESLIDNKLLQVEAAERNLEVTDELLNQQLSYFYQQYGGEENLKALLEKQGVDLNDIIENMKVDLQGQLAAKAEIDEKLNLTDEDLQAFYDANKESIKIDETFRASHILVKTEEEGAKEKAENLLAELNNGADFAELAKENSACPSGQSGGDLNFFGKGQMVPEFETAVIDLDVDQISGLVETQFGFHIIKKTDHQEARVLTFEEAKNQIKDVVSKEKSQAIMKEFITSLRGKYEIQYM